MARSNHAPRMREPVEWPSSTSTLSISDANPRLVPLSRGEVGCKQTMGDAR